MMRIFTSITFGLLLLIAANPLFASLIGDEITADAVWLNGIIGPTVLLDGATATVADGVTEFSVEVPPLGGSEFAINFSSGDVFSVLFEPADSAIWGVQFDITISDLDWVDGPGSLTGVQKTSGVSGFLDVIGFTANSISLSSS